MKTTLRLFSFLTLTSVLTGCVVKDQNGAFEESVAPLSVTSPARGSEQTSDFTLSGVCRTGINVKISGEISHSPLIVPCVSGNFSASISLSGADGSKELRIEQSVIASLNDYTSESASYLSYSLVKKTITPPSQWEIALYDSDRDSFVSEISDGKSFDLDSLTLRNMAIVANYPGAASFKFDVNGTTKVESVTPYVFPGDTNGDLRGIAAEIGSYTVKIQAYSNSNASGTLLAEKAMTFTLTKEVSVPDENSNSNFAYYPDSVYKVTKHDTANHFQCDLARDCDAVVGSNGSVYIASASPGQTFCVRPGTYKSAYMKNLRGTKEAPIRIINCGGQVTFTGTSSATVSLLASVHVKLLGIGDKNTLYGFKITDSVVHGISAANLSRDYEIAYWDISLPNGYAGISAKSENGGYDLVNTNQVFVQTGTHIHHNKISKTKTGEGIYAGYTNCFGNNSTKARLRGTRIHDNIITNTAREGIQLGCADRDTKVHNNYLYNVGLEGGSDHSKGLQVGGGTAGKFFNNWIEKATSNCVIIQGGQASNEGKISVAIFNNVFKDCGADTFYLHSQQYSEGGTTNNEILISNNTMLIGGKKLIGYGSGTGNLTMHILNNAIHSSIGLSLNRSNIVRASLNDFGFMDTSKSDYRLKDNSILVDQGDYIQNLGIIKDLKGQARGPIYDVGAFER